MAPHCDLCGFMPNARTQSGMSGDPEVIGIELNFLF
jgi:hypothetical protein